MEAVSISATCRRALFSTVDCLYHMHVFFPGIGTRRNCYIRNVVLFEENSILLLPESLESPEYQVIEIITTCKNIEIK